MKISACIFDLDGVIVDTAKYHYIAWKKIAESIGFEFTHEMNETLKGISRYDSLTKLLEMASVVKTEEEKQEICVFKNDYYLSLVESLDSSERLEGVAELLNELQSENIKIALGSASKNAIKILEQIDLKDKFEVIIDGNSVSRSKPDPEVFNLGAKSLNVLPSETIVFEDSQKGLEAAIVGGFISVGIGEPENLGIADIVIPGFGDINFSEIVHLLSEQLK